MIQHDPILTLMFHLILVPDESELQGYINLQELPFSIDHSDSSLTSSREALTTQIKEVSSIARDTVENLTTAPHSAALTVLTALHDCSHAFCRR